MNKLIILALVAIVLVGCTQVPKMPNVTLPGTHANVSANTTPGIVPPVNQDQQGTQGQNASEGQNATQNATQQSAFNHYDLSIKDVSFNTSAPVVSFFTTMTVTVGYEGKLKPAKYQVTYYDNNELVQSKTIGPTPAPTEEETASFYWLPTSDGTHTLKVVVESLDGATPEDGPASNNQMEKQVTVLPIGVFDGTVGKEVTARFYRAQQFTVQNKIGIGTLFLYLKSDRTPKDVQMVVEIRKDSVDTPGAVVKTKYLSAKNINTLQWFPVSYGTNGLYLEQGKYWVVLYLAEDSPDNPQWMYTTDTYPGKSAVLDKTQSYGNIWSIDSGAFAFKISTSP
ncbi:MAG: CARDB domain-containing protein [Candidatus ainarchaeum sp.]|nr:CARDB domain-containing protein [Candidatus ainarchaeum sp.]